MTQVTRDLFTAEQRQAIEHIGTPLFLIGGPGTGKTAVLVERARWLIEGGHASAFGTLVIAFGVRAARELRSRLHQVLPPDQAIKVHVKTISGWCLELLSTHGDLLGYRLTGKPLRVLDPADSSELLGAALAEVVAGLDRPRQAHPAGTGRSDEWSDVLKRLLLQDVAASISRAKHAGVGPEDYLGHRPTCADPAEHMVAAVYVAYQAVLKARNLLDFGDLILQADRLLHDYDEARSFAQSVYTSALIDEVQDVTDVEWRILSAVLSPKGLVTVAGDIDQSVHVWRGAMGPRCEAVFRTQFPDATILHLSENHRSGARIVRVAGTLIAPERRQRTRNTDGQPVLIIRANSEHDEADLVAGALAALVRGGGVTYAECAVMCRTNAQIDAVEQALVRASVPYQVLGRGTFFQRPEVQRMLGYLALVVDPMDDYALRRVAPGHLTRKQRATLRGDDAELRFDHLIVEGLEDAALVARVARLHLLIAQLGDMGSLALRPRAAMARIESLLASVPSSSAPLTSTFIKSDGKAANDRQAMAETHALKGHLPESLPDALADDDAGGSARSAENLRLLRALAEPYATIPEFFTDVDAWDGQDPTSDLGRDQAVVMTLHDAKGLEFPVAFLVGANEGVLPHYNAITPAGVADEGRLMYVGLTRAKRLAGVLWARERGGRPAQPSRFMQAWPNDSVVAVARSQVADVFSTLGESCASVHVVT